MRNLGFASWYKANQAAEEVDPHSPEAQLMQRFSELLAPQRIEDVVQALPDRRPARLADYEFTPLEGDVPRSLDIPGFKLPSDESVAFRGFPPAPFLDTAKAIGLVYDKQLIAVAGAGVGPGNVMTVVQIQAETGVSKDLDGKEYYKTGLHNGFYWRDTLVKVWENIAKSIGCPAIVIQSDENNMWPPVRNGDGHAYNPVAERMGYSQQVDGNWIKQLSAAEV